MDRPRPARPPDRPGGDVPLPVERLGAHSLTLALQCHGQRSDDVRMRMRQTLVTTSLTTHKAIEIPTDLRDAVARFAQIVH